MKLILAIVNNSDVKSITEEMMHGGFLLTKIGSTGGLLKGGNTTLISAVQNERVEKALQIISTTSHGLKYQATEHAVNTSALNMVNMTGEIVVGGATVFVLNIEETYKF